MARLARKTSKLFAENATATNIGQFGSLNAGTKVETNDIDTIQALPAWGDGWEAAGLGQNCYPTLQERNGLDKVQSYFLNYLLQEGIPEWDSGTTYYTGSIVKLINGTDVQFFQSLVDNNTAVLSDTNSWKNFKSGGSGLEVCDIGMALYVDETKGLRRYLNGQIVDINTNTQAFLDRLKQITALHPSLLCTEEKWQAAKTLSAFGQVGKFVFNYSGEKIVSVRLPRVVNVQGLFDLQNLGMTVEAGLPTHTHTRGTMNITGSIGSRENSLPWSNGAFWLDGYAGTNDYHNEGNTGNMRSTINFDASRSWTGSTSTGNYSKALATTDTVQQEQIQYPYFIQIATGSETENNIINEIELNNPYSLFDSKYSDHELNNLSWLKSQGQWNSKAVYTDAYDKLLKVYNGTETVEGLSVKLSTETYTDYDFVLNTAEETFRLPLKNHTADDSIKGLTLYFYVGETVQNANLIDAGRIEEKLSDKADTDLTNVTNSAKVLMSGMAMPSDKYINLTLGANNTTYTAPADGYFMIKGMFRFLGLHNKLYYVAESNVSTSFKGGFVPCPKGGSVTISYDITPTSYQFIFVYAVGSESEVQ